MQIERSASWFGLCNSFESSERCNQYKKQFQSCSGSHLNYFVLVKT